MDIGCGDHGRAKRLCQRTGKRGAASGRFADRKCSPPQGVIRIHEGAWYGPVGKDGSKQGGNEIGALCSYGDPNTLTQDIGSSKLAQACAAYTCLVEFEKFSGKVPEVSAFSGPIEISR